MSDGRGKAPAHAAPARPRWWRGRDGLGLLFVLAPMLFLFAVLIVPIVYNMWVSLHSWRLTDVGGPEFVGLDNYVEVLWTPRWRDTIVRTAAFVVLTVGLQVVIGFGVALFLHKHFPRARALRVALLLPMMVSEVAVGNMWRLLYNYDGGLLNWALGLVGIDRVFWLGPDMAFASIVLTDVWQNAPFVTLVIFAALQTMPNELLEAADLDGASGWVRIRRVILPIVQPAVLLVLIFQTMFAIRAFGTIWILTEGGPGTATTLLSIDIFRVALQSYDVGLASTLSWFLVAINLIVAIIYMRWLKREPLT
ncbi:sugar ABC transporter permease [Phytohabitans sp. ZYX-F-186]|uniref:Sugar ABC transporter permease n=1 Tax=Phytohabitans maris TaxID=3071409 RepID=A0ABU0ZCL6_9ACTN|nr:sugar ABC transporter permease [Phytohabitans sp. ZYX-F-186]MDQ7904795.1 sugar ABC transporter permease [Phytohabitans sp. ZYX-F-186]